MSWTVKCSDGFGETMLVCGIRDPAFTATARFLSMLHVHHRYGQEQQDPGQQDSNHCYRPALAKGQIIRISAGMLGLMFGWAIKVHESLCP